MNQEYAQRGRFYADSEGVEGVAQEVLHDAGVDKKTELASFFSRYVAGTDELPLADWLWRAGLALESRGQRNATFGFTICAQCRRSGGGFRSGHRKRRCARRNS